MPSTSEKQAAMMAKAAHNSHYAEAAGVSQKVAKEFHAADVAKGRRCDICSPGDGTNRLSKVK